MPLSRCGEHLRICRFPIRTCFLALRRIDIKPFDFNETVRLEAVGKLYRSIASGSVGKRNRFVSIARLRITTESNFAALRLAEVQVINQFEHFVGHLKNTCRKKKAVCRTSLPNWTS